MIPGGVKLSLFCLICVSWNGCGSAAAEVERTQLTGLVTWNGQPLEKGDLRLIPLSGGAAQATGAEILGGKYAVKNKGGVIPRTYRIEVTANRVVKDKPPPDGESVAVEQYLPDRFNAKSILVLTIPEGTAAMAHDIALQE